MRAFILVRVEAFAIVASHTFAGDDPRPTNRSPLTGFFTDLARVAFGPALDRKERQVGKQSQKRSDGTKKAAVQIPDEHGRSKQYGKTQPHPNSSLKREHPERFDISIDGDVPRDEEV